MGKILLFWKSISIFIFCYRFQNKNNFDESLRNFINQIQVHIINYLGTSFPPNHLQVQTEHLEEKAQRIDEHPSSSYSMVPLSLTPSRTTTLKKNLGSNASGNMFQRTNTLQSLNLPGESSNNQNLKRSLNDPNLGYIPKLMKHTHFQVYYFSFKVQFRSLCFSSRIRMLSLVC